MPQKKRLSPCERADIDELIFLGLSYREIGRITGRLNKVIRNYLKSKGKHDKNNV